MTKAANNDVVDYVGIRWGLNMTGLRRGDELHRAVVAAYDRFLATAGTQTTKVRDLLLALPPAGLEACIRALAGTQSLDEEAVGRLTQVCGGSPMPADPSVITGLQEAISAARIQADSKYYGLDLRADFGDLSLAGVDTVRGTSRSPGSSWSALWTAWDCPCT